MLHSLLSSAIEASKGAHGVSGALPLMPQLASPHSDSIIPVSGDDIEEVFRGVSKVDADICYFYSSPQGHISRLDVLPAVVQPSVASIVEASAVLALEDCEPMVTDILSHISRLAPRTDPAMNPFYSLANGYGVIIKGADRRSQKLEWICKGVGAPAGGPLFRNVAHVTCDVVCVPKGVGLGADLFKTVTEGPSSSLSVTGYLVLTVAGESCWRFSSSKTSSLIACASKSLHYVDASGADVSYPEHVPSRESGATLCIFHLYGAPSFEATFTHMVSGILESSRCVGGKGTNVSGEVPKQRQKGKAKGAGAAAECEADAFRSQFIAARDALLKDLSFDRFEPTQESIVASLVASRAAAVRANVRGVQLPLTGLTRFRWSPTMTALLDFKEWRQVAKAHYSASDVATPIVDALWSSAIEAFEASNASLLESSASHIMAVRRADGSVLQFRCCFALGQAAALLHHRSPSTVSLAELTASCVGSGEWDTQRGMALISALAILGLVVRTQG